MSHCFWICLASLDTLFLCPVGQQPGFVLSLLLSFFALQVINNLIIYKFFKDFTNHKKKTNRVVAFSCRPSSNIFKYRDHQWDLPTIWKTRLLQTLIKSSASMYIWKFRLQVVSVTVKNFMVLQFSQFGQWQNFPIYVSQTINRVPTCQNR